MRQVIAIVLVTTVVMPAVLSAQQSAAPAIEASAFKQMAAAIPAGTLVRVQTTAGRRLTATLMQANDDGIVVKRESRVPEPALSIRYDELSSLKRHVPRGMGLGKVIGIGLAAGAGAMLALVAIVASVAD